VLVEMPELDAIRAALSDTRAGTAFDIVVVTDNTGALVAADWSDNVSGDTFSALLALAQRVVNRPNGVSALVESGESHFFDWDGRQVVCRPFEVVDQPWLLVALAPPRGTYKQALGRLIKQLQAELALASPKPSKPTKTSKPRAKRKTPSRG
jgi:hypothetical protein